MTQGLGSIDAHTNANGNGQSHERQAPLMWDAAEVDALASADHVYFVQITDGHGGSIKRLGRREGPALASVAIDVAIQASAQCGARLDLGDIAVSAQIFSGGLLVTTRAKNGATVSALASPQANLGQVLNHIRRIGATFKEGGTGR